MPKTKDDLTDRQMTLSDAIALVHSEKIYGFSVWCNMMCGNQKVRTSFEQEEYESLEEFVKNIDNYGSFWLTIEYSDGLHQRQFQLVDDNTFEPL